MRVNIVVLAKAKQALIRAIELIVEVPEGKRVEVESLEITDEPGEAKLTWYFVDLPSMGIDETAT